MGDERSLDVLDVFYGIWVLLCKSRTGGRGRVFSSYIISYISFLVSFLSKSDDSLVFSTFTFI